MPRTPPIVEREKGGLFAKVDVAPTRTSIYIGTVSMTMPTFVRVGDTFQTTYAAKVFPFMFYNEHGTLTINATDAQLEQLAKGETVILSGQGIRDDGASRRVEAS